MVAMPPRVAAAGIPIMLALVMGALLPSFRMSGRMAAIIMAVEAVLDKMDDASHVVTIKPKSARFGSVPKSPIEKRNTCISRPARCIPLARKNPPSRSQMTELERVSVNAVYEIGSELKYGELNARTPTPMIINPVAKGGMASVSHKPTERHRRKSA